MPPVAMIPCAVIMTLSTRDMTANTAESGTRLVLIPCLASSYAVWCPVNFGAVSQTITSKFDDSFASMKKLVSVVLVW